ncbi:M24 family metallopeptidase [Chloroflexota bacterium]
MTMQYELTPRGEIQSRTTLFQASLRDNGLEWAIITQNADLFYLSGTIQNCYLFVPAEGEPLLAVRGNLDRALQETGLNKVAPLKNIKHSATVLSDFNYTLRGRVGLEMDVLPVKYYFDLCREFPEADFYDVTEIIRKVRMIKSDYEISQIRKGCDILNQVMREAQQSIRPGMTELEVDSFLGALARRLGHQGRLRMRGYNQEMFYAHVLSGETAAIPSFLAAPLGGMGTTPAIAQGASYNTIVENQPIIIDFGVGINGYVTDMTRTFVIGNLPPELQQAYEFTVMVKNFMEEWVIPGRSCSSLYKEVLNLVHQKGYQDSFMGWKEKQVAFVGHGIGLEIDEYPLIAPSFHHEFQRNMVFAFEPKLVFPGKGAVGVEDDYVVTETGVERITTYSDQLLTVSYP